MCIEQLAEILDPPLQNRSKLQATKLPALPPRHQEVLITVSVYSFTHFPAHCTNYFIFPCQNLNACFGGGLDGRMMQIPARTKETEMLRVDQGRSLPLDDLSRSHCQVLSPIHLYQEEVPAWTRFLLSMPAMPAPAGDPAVDAIPLSMPAGRRSHYRCRRRPVISLSMPAATAGDLAINGLASPFLSAASSAAAAAPAAKNTQQKKSEQRDGASCPTMKHRLAHIFNVSYYSPLRSLSPPSLLRFPLPSPPRPNDHRKACHVGHGS